MTKEAESPFTEAAYRANPYAVYEQLRNETPVYKTVLPNGVELFLVTRYADVQAGLKDPRLVKNVHNTRPQGLLGKLGLDSLNNSNVLRADPPDHTRLRNLANTAFKPKYINQLRGHIEEIANDLLDKVQASGKMDLMADFALPLPITVICEMLGVPAKDQNQSHAWSTALITSGALSSERPHIGAELLQLGNYVRKLIAEHRKQQPDQMKKLKQDLALVKPAVEEILRYVNPVQIVNRYAAEDLEIAGQKIPRGSHLQLVLTAANHDPALFADPEKLNITREESRHVAFSQGIHYCLGAPLARLEGEIAFTTLLKRMPDIHLEITPADLKWRPAFELRGLQALPVVF